MALALPGRRKPAISPWVRPRRAGSFTGPMTGAAPGGRSPTGEEDAAPGRQGRSAHRGVTQDPRPWPPMPVAHATPGEVVLGLVNRRGGATLGGMNWSDVERL